MVALYGCVCFQSFKLAFWFSFVRGLAYSFSTIYHLTSMWFLTNKWWIQSLSTAGPACIVMQNTYLTFHIRCLCIQLLKLLAWDFGCLGILVNVHILLAWRTLDWKYVLTQGCDALGILNQKMGLSIEGIWCFPSPLHVSMLDVGHVWFIHSLFAVFSCFELAVMQKF